MRRRPAAAPAANNPDTAFEPSDWAVAPVVLSLVGASVLAIVALVVLSLEFGAAVNDAERRLITEMPQPRLQVAPLTDLAALHAREDHDLNTYYWVDRAAGLVHIPIDEAMEQVAAHGLDGFPAAPK